MKKITKKDIIRAIERAGFNLVQYKNTDRIYLVSSATRLNPNYEILVTVGE
jgi:predicted RNA binding protein YcfA (HicA-like mRNA interferase family)